MEFPEVDTDLLEHLVVYTKVLFCNNKFSKGPFTQTLQTIPDQKQESDTKQVAPDATGAVTTTEENKQISTTEFQKVEGGKDAPIRILLGHDIPNIIKVEIHLPNNPPRARVS